MEIISRNIFIVERKLKMDKEEIAIVASPYTIDRLHTGNVDWSYNYDHSLTCIIFKETLDNIVFIVGRIITLVEENDFYLMHTNNEDTEQFGNKKLGNLFGLESFNSPEGEIVIAHYPENVISERRLE
jgi:hypothetical protein